MKCKVMITALRTAYAIGRISLVQARPSFDPPCGSHQLPVIPKYSERIFGTQLNCQSFYSLVLYRQVLLVIKPCTRVNLVQGEEISNEM